MRYEISINEAQPQVVLMRHVVVDEIDLPSTIGATFDEAYGYLGRVGILPVGPPFIIYHHGPDGLRWEADICVPVIQEAANPTAGFEFTKIAGGLVVSTLHVGPYETVSTAYGAMADWTRQHGYEFVGPPREIYLSEPGVLPDETETKVEWPVAMARVPAAASI
jgi:AraC family transcriptional regulator